MHPAGRTERGGSGSGATSCRTRRDCSIEQYLFLFDIDGTLLTAGEQAVDAYSRAFLNVLGTAYNIREVDCAGRTDLHIIKKILAKYGHNPSDRALIRDVFRNFIDALHAKIDSGITLSPIDGAHETIQFLMECPNTHLGLITGNLEEGAYLKLRGAGMDTCFRFGAFGSDHEDRNRLGELALKRAEHDLELAFHPDNVFVVGDTEHDILCARSAGFRAIAVTTGAHPSKKLLSHEPDYLIDRLSPDFFSRIIL